MLKLSRTTFLLTISDIFTWGGYLAISNIVGIYLSQKLGQNAIEIIGVGTGIYLVTRACLQVPMGLLIDRIRGDRDEILLLGISTLLMGLPFLIYPSLESVTVYYLLQVSFGIGTALNLVNWRKLFAQNLTKDREGMTYAMYDTVNSLAVAMFTTAAGIFANRGIEEFGSIVFLCGVLISCSGLIPMLIFRDSKRKLR